MVELNLRGCVSLSKQVRRGLIMPSERGTLRFGLTASGVLTVSGTRLLSLLCSEFPVTDFWSTVDEERVV